MTEATTPTRRRRWLLLTIGLGVPTLMLLTCASFCVGSPSYYRGKYRPAGVAVSPSAIPARWAPQQQVEPHTCGFHALSSVYVAYGLDPERNSLRFRLGTDKRGVNFDADSLGTIHPDILRVVAQDGFDATTFLTGGASACDPIRAHLASGHPVLALIRVTGPHWVVLTGLEEDAVVICDSMQPELVREPFERYIEDRVLSAIALRPRQD